MTVASETSRSGPYTGNGVTNVFDYGFRILNENHLRVIRTENGVETVLTIDADYIVSDVGAASGGQIALVTPPTASQTITILRDVPFTQETDLENQGPYFAETVEEGFDAGVMRDQQLAERLDRAIVIPASADPSSLNALVEDVLRLADSADAIDAVANNETNINTVAGINAAVTTVAGIANDIPTVAALSGEIVAIGPVASDIPTVAANVTDITNFADVYQGPKAADPVLRNNGSALQAGDLYFNSTTDQMRVYDGAEWHDASAQALNMSAQSFVGDGTGTDFVLNVAPAVAANVIVWVGGVRQVPNDDYTVSGPTLTISPAPGNGVDVDTLVVSTISTLNDPADGSVSFQKLDAGLKSAVRIARRDAGTIAEAIADFPEVDPDFYRVAFYDSSMTLASGGLYRKVASEPSHLGKFRNRAGAGSWYELAEDEVTPQMLGWQSGDLTPFFAACVDMQRPIKLPKRAGGYVANTGFSKVLTAELIVDFQGQKIAFDHQKTWEFKGQEIVTSYLFSSSRDRYATNVLVHTVSGVQDGDLLYVNNAGETPLSSWSDTKKECILITSVSGNQLNLAAGLNFNWALLDASNVVTVFRPQKVTFIRPWFHQAAPVAGQPHRNVHFIGLRDIELISPKLTAPLTLNRQDDIYRMGIQIWKCWGWTVTDMYTEGLAYPIGVYGGTRNGFETRTKAHYCHHGHADLGDFASDYFLDGFHATDCYMALNTHPCFRAYANNIDVQNNFDVSTWRCIGGGLSNGIIRTSADDTKASAQFQSELPASGFGYLYSDADFYCRDFKFETTGARTTKDLFWVSLGRHVHYENILVPRLSDFTTATGIVFLSVGSGVVSLAGATNFRGPGQYNYGALQ